MEERLNEMLFGKAQVHAKTAIITPISAIYNRFSGIESRGWWRMKTTGDDIILLAPKCTHIEDALHHLPTPERYLFLGYCGSLIDEIGSVVTATAVRDHGRWRDITPCADLPQRRAAQVQSFRQQDNKYLGRLRAQGVEIIDMESRSVARTAKAPLSAIYVVTDNPLTKPFYMIDAQDVQATGRGLDEALHYVEEWQ